MQSVAKKKKTSSGNPKRPPANRTGIPLYVYVSSQLDTALDHYCENAKPRVSKTAAVEEALLQFLTARGCWPPSPQLTPPTP